MHVLSSPTEMIKTRLWLNGKDVPTQALKYGFEASVSSLQILRQGVRGLIFSPMKQELGFLICEIKWEDQTSSQVRCGLLTSGPEVGETCVRLSVHAQGSGVQQRLGTPVLGVTRS